MLMIGLKPVQRPLPGERQVCPRCMDVTDHALVEREQQVMFYFIPLFSIRHEVVYTCQQCGDAHVILFEDYLHNHPKPQTPLGASESGPAGAKPPHEKPHVTLNGKVVDGEVNTSLPWRAKINADGILKWLYISFAAILVVAVIMVLVLIPGLIH
jgi:hypothetical protein